MRRVVLALALIAVLATTAGVGWYTWNSITFPPPPPWTDDMQVVADGSNRFALDLYGKLRDTEKGNIFFSPYSIHTALGMTATGAKGQTRDEMVDVLHLPADEQKMPASGDLGRYYAHPRRDFELSVANALWGQKGFPWRPEWLAMQNDRFGAGFNEADFAANPDTERQRINHWVEEQTQKRITELLLPGQITPWTTMALTNAIYFKGQWSEEFDSKRTRDVPFQLIDGTTVQMPMMSGSPKCSFGFSKGLWLVELPYKGDELSMVIILPDKWDGLPTIEEQLSPALLNEWLATLRPTKGHPVQVPRFRIESRFDLPGQLKALGMLEAFSERADFSGMASTKPGPITAVAHKAFVDVNEEGTEAAAATAVIIGDVSAPRPFVADHPFLFLIRDTKHSTILFMGRVMNPKE